MSVTRNKFSIDVAATTKFEKSNPPPSEITVRQFLEFLRTAYQVQDTVEGTLLSQGFKEAVDWIKLKDTQLVKREAEVQTSNIRIGDAGEKRDLGRRKSDSAVVANGDNVLKAKLGEVLSEGLLDSVLPYLIPTNSLKKIPTTSKLSGTTITNKESTITVKKSIETCETTKSTITKNE